RRREPGDRGRDDPRGARPRGGDDRHLPRRGRPRRRGHPPAAGLELQGGGLTMQETRIFSNGVVTPEGSVAAELVLRDGAIEAVELRASPSAGALDWSGDLVIPGLVDIHTDNLEKHYQPRPGALWDAYGAALAHDAQ